MLMINSAFGHWVKSGLPRARRERALRALLAREESAGSEGGYSRGAETMDDISRATIERYKP